MRKSIIRTNIYSLFVIAAILVVAVSFTSGYETSTGTKPEVQTMTIVSAETRSISGFKICREGVRRCEEIADIFNEFLYENQMFELDVISLDNLSNEEDQLVIGSISNDTIANLADELEINIIGLGEEGYNLISCPNPSSSNDSWIIFILTDSSEANGYIGLLNGVYTLLDLTSNGSEPIGNFRIRDYPDLELRSFFHWIPDIPDTSENINEWLVERRTNIRNAAVTGCNAVHLGRSDSWRMEEYPDESDRTYGQLMAQVAYWARYYGVEPIMEIGKSVPGNVGWQYPLWREGEYIEKEPFIVEEVSGEYYLKPLIEPFDNARHNLDFETKEEDLNWPEDWEVTTGSNSNWQYQYDSEEGDSCIIFAGGTPGSLYSISRIIEDPVSFFQSNSYYNITVKHKDVYRAGTNYPKIWVIMHKTGSAHGDTLGWRGLLSANINDNRYDYFFWTPPTYEERPDGYDPNAPRSLGFWEEDYLESIEIKIIVDGDNTIQINDLFLERRASALRNVMIDEQNGLEFLVEDDSAGIYVKDIDYEIIKYPNDYYTMWTFYSHDNITRIKWLDTETITDTLLVSFTAGVPLDWESTGQKSTYCLLNPAFRAFIGSHILPNFYTEYDILDANGNAMDYAINPKYIDLRVDEIRGINRCGRCNDSGYSNKEYFEEYISAMRNMLDVIDGASETRLIMSADMISPYHNGGYDAYQIGYGGIWGASAIDFGVLPGSLYAVSLGHTWISSETICNDWPYSAGAPDEVKIQFLFQSENPTDYETPEDYVRNPICYGDDILGFTSIGYDDSHTEIEERFIDFAWKKYMNPFAALHVIQDNKFVTDNVLGNTIEVNKNETLSFLTFGSAEVRDTSLVGNTVSSAVITWPDESEYDVLNALNSNIKFIHKFDQPGFNTITLTLEAPSIDAGIDTTSVQVVVKVLAQGGGGPKGTAPEGLGQDNDLPKKYELFQNYPNPFNPNTIIRFDLPKASHVKVAIYSVKGELIRTVVDGMMTAGKKSIAWDGHNESGEEVVTGMYFYRIETAEFTESRKMILLR